jgi:hypothetical protein
MEQWGDVGQVFDGNGGAVCRRVSTILEIWSVFHTKMALDTKLKQLALFMISW